MTSPPAQRSQGPSHGPAQRLFSWWERIDAWIDDNRPVDLPTRGRRGAGSPARHPGH